MPFPQSIETALENYSAGWFRRAKCINTLKNLPEADKSKPEVILCAFVEDLPTEDRASYHVFLAALALFNEGIVYIFQNWINHSNTRHLFNPENIHAIFHFHDISQILKFAYAIEMIDRINYLTDDTRQDLFNYNQPIFLEDLANLLTLLHERDLLDRRMYIQLLNHPYPKNFKRIQRVIIEEQVDTLNKSHLNILIDYQPPEMFTIILNLIPTLYESNLLNIPNINNFIESYNNIEILQLLSEIIFFLYGNQLNENTFYQIINYSHLEKLENLRNFFILLSDSNITVNERSLDLILNHTNPDLLTNVAQYTSTLTNKEIEKNSLRGLYLYANMTETRQSGMLLYTILYYSNEINDIENINSILDYFHHNFILNDENLTLITDLFDASHLPRLRNIFRILSDKNMLHQISLKDLFFVWTLKEPTKVPIPDKNERLEAYENAFKDFEGHCSWLSSDYPELFDNFMVRDDTYLAHLSFKGVITHFPKLSTTTISLTINSYGLFSPPSENPPPSYYNPHPGYTILRARNIINSHIPVTQPFRTFFKPKNIDITMDSNDPNVVERLNLIARQLEYDNEQRLFSNIDKVIANTIHFVDRICKEEEEKEKETSTNTLK